MTDDPVPFSLQTTAVDVGDPLQTDSPVHIYAGTLADSSEAVRLFTTAPDVSDEHRRRVEHSFEAWNRLATHPGISTVLTSGDEPRTWIAVTSAGQPLSAVAPLSADRTRSVLADVAEALRHALGLAEGRATAAESSKDIPVTTQHARVVDESGLCDWPVDSEGDRLDESPEPPDGVAETTEQRAVFRLGAIAFEAVAGHPPAVEESTPAPSSVDDTVPEAFDAVVTRALNPDPRERFGSLYEFKRALLFERSTPTDSSPATAESISERWNEAVEADMDTPERARESISGSDSESDRETRFSRRVVLGAVGAGVVGAVAGGAWFTTSRLLTSETERFPTFRYDAANTGYAPGAVGPTEGVTEAWSVPLGQDVVSSPVVDSGVVLTSAEDGLFALDTADGAERWQADAGSPLFFGPTLGDGVVYLARRDVDAAGGLVAFDLEDGEERWFEHGELFAQGTPVLHDGRVYSIGGNGLQAFELSERTVVWSSEEFWSTSLSGAVVDETLYFAGSPNTGEPHLVAVDTADGSERWTVSFDSLVNTSPAVADGLVVIGDSDGMLFGIDAADGEQRWKFEADDGLVSSPAIASGMVYVGSESGDVYAVDASGGEQQWRFETGGEIISSPTVVSETVYVGSTDDTVYALDVDGGDERWRFETGGEVLSSPAVVCNTVFIGSTDGYLYALTEPE